MKEQRQALRNLAELSAYVLRVVQQFGLIQKRIFRKYRNQVVTDQLFDEEAQRQQELYEDAIVTYKKWERGLDEENSADSEESKDDGSLQASNRQGLINQFYSSLLGYPVSKYPENDEEEKKN